MMAKMMTKVKSSNKNGIPLRVADEDGLCVLVVGGVDGGVEGGLCVLVVGGVDGVMFVIFTIQFE
jgi:hypothetical protein